MTRREAWSSWAGWERACSRLLRIASVLAPTGSQDRRNRGPNGLVEARQDFPGAERLRGPRKRTRLAIAIIKGGMSGLHFGGAGLQLEAGGVLDGPDIDRTERQNSIERAVHHIEPQWHLPA